MAEVHDFQSDLVRSLPETEPAVFSVIITENGGGASATATFRRGHLAGLHSITVCGDTREEALEALRAQLGRFAPSLLEQAVEAVETWQVRRAGQSDLTLTDVILTAWPSDEHLRAMLNGDSWSHRPYAEIGEMLCVTRQRARQWTTKIVRRLREALDAF